MIERLLRNYKIKTLLVVTIILLLLGSVGYGLYSNYQDNKKAFYNHIDSMLHTTANDANLILGLNFHDKVINKNSITPDEDMKNIKKLSSFANDINNIAYVYTMIIKDEKVYFTSSSATDEEIEENDLPRYFDPYDEATEMLKNIFKENKIVYEESTDKWGTFRTILIPNTTDNGTKYVVGADVQIDYIQDQLDKFFYNSLIFLFILIIFLSILIYQFVKISKTELIEIRNLKESLENEIQERTNELNIAKQEVEAIHKHTRDSIEYASLIQGALIPQNGAMTPFFKDHFVTWTPKDTVGGDIWLFEELRDKDECLLMFIDCTGHGVPGAFVTMIVKAVEREIISIINTNQDMNVSPAWVMSYFNKTIKKLLRQESKNSLSNAGWDGGIIYYNKKTQILKFAGAETSLFYMTANGEFKTIKGNRYSVGYKKCDSNYEYKETIIEVEDGMKFYCTTDGYLDQNGGKKDFPFGKKRFSNIIKEHHNKPMIELQTIFKDKMIEWETTIPNNDRNDDMTIIAFEIDKTKVV